MDACCLDIVTKHRRLKSKKLIRVSFIVLHGRLARKPVPASFVFTRFHLRLSASPAIQLNCSGLAAQTPSHKKWRALDKTSGCGSGVTRLLNPLGIKP